MGAFGKVIHFADEDVSSLCSFINELEVEGRHSIPLGKILFTLFRKKYLRTVLTETNPQNPQYLAECSLSGGRADELVRYHFFREENEEGLTPGSYGGYCDVRPDATIVDAFITLFTITGGSKDSYVFVPCRMEQSVDVPLPGGDLLNARVTGFPYMEKNHKETMCAQAALLGAVKYWKSKFPGSFSEVESAIDINRLAGVPEDRAGGLSAPEMTQFFHAVGQDVKFCDYSFQLFDEVGRKHLLTDVYSFIESGCPVIAGVKTYSDGHALTFIGHTFDKNSWSAMADLGYYGQKNEFFHENTTWIEHLIIQDDNFGPYFFFPLKKLPDIISCMIVPVPSPSIKVLPHEAANFAVRKTLYNQEFGEFLAEYLKSIPLSASNVSWYNEFIRHLKPVCGDGLVLRSILRKGCDIIEAYKEHEFASIPEVLLHGLECHYYWMVELSWPDIYCFGQSQSGVILVDAETAEIHMVHIPGVCIAFSEGKAYVSVAEKEDSLRPHHKPGTIA